MQKKKHDEHGQPLHTPHHPKQDFQVERIAFFSDAVYAIAITLLVIEFKIPEVTKDTTAGEIWHQLLELKYKFFSLILSFTLITNYWVRHHLLFKHIHNYNKQIVVSNMMGLLPIIFFPFTTALFYASVENKDVMLIATRLFLLNNIIAGGASYYFYWTVMKRFKEITYPMEKKDQQVFELELFTMILSFLLTFILTFLLPLEYALFGILPMLFVNLWNKYFNKAAK